MVCNTIFIYNEINYIINIFFLVMASKIGNKVLVVILLVNTDLHDRHAKYSNLKRNTTIFPRTPVLSILSYSTPCLSLLFTSFYKKALQTQP